MSISLFLVRHGNTFEQHEVCTHVGSATDLPLTEQGCVQAEIIASYLKEKGVQPAAIYCGNLQRQVKTAEIICRGLGFDKEVIANTPVLDELALGPWEGLTTEEIIKRWPEQYSLWEQAGKWPAKVFEQTFAERKKLVQEFISHLCQCYADGSTVVAASSNGAIRLFQTAPGGQWQQCAAVNEMKRLKVATGSISELTLEASGIKVCSWNLRP